MEDPEQEFRFSHLHIKTLIRNICVVFTLQIFFLSCNNTEQEISEYKVEKLPEDVSEEFFLKYIDSGLLNFTLYSPLMYFVQEKENSYSRFENGVEIIFYTPDRKVKNIIKGKQGKWEQSTGKAEIKYDVIVVNESGDTLSTEELYWDKRLGKIYTPLLVHITSPIKKIWGIGFEADENFTKYKISNIKGQIQIKNEKTKEDEKN